MTKLSKALLAAGLSAALAACGGGGDDSATVPASPSEPDSPPTAPTVTPADAAAKSVKASYDFAKGLIDDLDNQSSPGQLALAGDAIAELLEDIQENDDLSTKDREDFLSKITSLQDALDGINRNVATTGSWENSIRSYTVSGNMRALPDSVDAGISTLRTTRGGISFRYNGTPTSGTPVSGLPSGWIGSSHQRNYADGRVDSGRIFADRPSAPETWEWDDLWNQQAVRPNSFLGGEPLVNLTLSW